MRAQGERGESNPVFSISPDFSLQGQRKGRMFSILSGPLTVPTFPFFFSIFS